MRFVRIPVAALAVAAMVPVSASAQIVASERGSVTQTVDGTVMTVDYARPSLRGREYIFDTEVPRDLLWTPGADMATTLELSKDVTIEGVDVPAGKYSVWMVARHGDWDVILDPEPERFHLPHIERSEEQFAFTVTPDTTAPFLETLTFTFANIRATGVDLRMRWEHTSLDVPITVQPTRDLTMTAEAAAPYEGHYLISVDSTDMGPPRQFEANLRYEEPYLSTVLDLFPEVDPFDTHFAPASDQVFNPVRVINGEIAGVLGFIFIEFDLDDDGLASRFVARLPDDSVWMRGERMDD